MIYTAGQQVRIMHSGATGRVFLKLPLRDVYLVQFPGFPVVEKIYNGCDLEPATSAGPPPEAERTHHHHA
ncbi:MAG TPA: hypothetical protein VHZ25_00080 [Acidobacteriaceae bacterium]|nr:hypothetical protein [Acidobacteriaceae bacterium]